MFRTVADSMNVAAHGWRAATYPILYFVGLLFFELGMIIFSVAIAASFLPDLLFHGGIAPVDARFLACFVGMVCAAFFVFKSACQLMWWRNISHVALPRSGEWIQDLPAVMGINMMRDVARYVCSGAAFCAMLGILINASRIGMIVFAICGVLRIFIAVMYPAVLAERLTRGSCLINAISCAFHRILRQPFRAIGVRAAFSLVRILCISLFAVYLALSCAWAAIVALVLLFIATLVEPAFWIPSAGSSATD